MRIGEVSRITGVSVPTIRYYISMGLLVPDQVGSQFLFNEDDIASLNVITRFKDWGFKLNEIHSILTLRRISLGVETEEYNDYISILSEHKGELIRQKAQIQKSIDEIDAEMEQRINAHVMEKKTGLPLKFLDMTTCPLCGRDLMMRDVDMDTRYIYNGVLHCECGFQAEIRNGIIYMPQGEEEEYDKPDAERGVYRSCPNELMSLIQKSYNWMSTEVHSLPEKENRVVLETHLNSFFYLYKNFKYFSKSDLFIIQDKFPEVIEMYKKYLDRAGLDLNIMYIVSERLHLPIKPETVDILIDYNSTNEHAIFTDTFFPSRMRPYLRKGAYIVGTYFYFQPMSGSLKQLRESYPRNQMGNYTHDYFFANIGKEYTLVKQEPLGVTTDSGEGITFIFHKNGEKLFLNGYIAKAR